MVRSALITLGVLFGLVAPAGAQDPQAGLAPPVVISAAQIRHDGAKVGTLTVSREGSAIVATAAFKGRPPGKTMSLCVTADDERHCASRKARRNGTVTLEATADFLTPLTAKARSGGARGSLKI